MIAAFIDKINVVDIWRDHLRTFVDAGNDQRRASDYLLFYALPAVPVVALAYFGVNISIETTDVLATSLSVLAGLLFNLIVLLHSLDLKKWEAPRGAAVKQLFWELHSNIAYAIMVALVTLVPLVAATYFQAGLVRRALGYVVAYLGLHFILTMGMVLKRTDTMLQLKKDN